MNSMDLTWQLSIGLPIVPPSATLGDDQSKPKQESCQDLNRFVVKNGHVGSRGCKERPYGAGWNMIMPWST